MGLEFETHETHDDLVAAVITHARQHRDELRVFDRGVEIEEPEKWPEVRKAIDADRAAAEAQRQSRFVDVRLSRRKPKLWLTTTEVA